MSTQRSPEQILRDEPDELFEEIETLGHKLLLDATDKLTLSLPAAPYLNAGRLDPAEFRADYLLGEGLTDEPEPVSHHVGIALHASGIQVGTVSFDKSVPMDRLPETAEEGARQREAVLNGMRCVDFFSVAIPELSVRFEGYQSGLSSEEAQVLTSVMQHPELEVVTYQNRLRYATLVMTAAVDSLLIRQHEMGEFMQRKDAELG